MSDPLCDFSVTITANCLIVPPTLGGNPKDPIVKGDVICFTNENPNTVTVDFGTSSPFSASSFSVPNDGNPHPQTVVVSPPAQTKYPYKVTGCLHIETDDGGGIIIVDPPVPPKPRKKPAASASAAKKAKPKAKTRSKSKAKGTARKKASSGRKKSKSSRRKKK